MAATLVLRRMRPDTIFASFSFPLRSLTTAPCLIGPPEIYDNTQPRLTGPLYQNPATVKSSLKEKESITATTKPDPFMDLMSAEFNPTTSMKKVYTENHSPTFPSTGNPCLDFFFHVVPDTPTQSLTSRLQLAWDQDPSKALKLIFNLRGIRGTGKSDREGFCAAALWLHDRHPKTLAGNVHAVADFGYLKDLLEILFLLLDGGNARRLVREEWRRRKYRKTGALPIQEPSRRAKKIERARKVVERFNTDPVFRFLHERVSDLFAQLLRSDMQMLNSGNFFKLSLAAKWCPSIDSSFDKITLLCEPIAKKVFPRAEYAEYRDIEEAHYAYRVRDRLRKEVLVPLRKAMQLPEVYIGANDWGSIPYNRVASVAMKLYKERFKKHDGERFRNFLGEVKSGKANVAAGALLPHEIVSHYLSAYLYGHDGKEDEVAELQWKRMVEDMAKIGKLKNSLAICDVSGSMDGTPLDVSVALGLLVSELSEEPWKGKLITFSEKPQLQTVKGDSLKEKTRFVFEMEWDLNTDFQKVFDVILQVAENGKLRGDEMIKRLFVFSDMEFDQASLNPWETDYEAIVRKFREKGYGECVPEIVFWNLRDSVATPVTATQRGVALVSGFSKNFIKVFMEEGVVTDPVHVMEAAISGKEYQNLVVLD